MDSRSLLIYAPVPVYRASDGGLFLDDQACNGLRLWADNFAKVVVMLPIADGVSPSNWVSIEAVGPNLARIEIEPLPMAYRPDQFLRRYSATRRRIAALIERADLMGFAIGGLFGDWGAVSCFEAHRQGRPYYVWTDRVESQVERHQATHGPWKRRLRAYLTHRPMFWLERAVIKRAALGLFHGKETFDTYARYCRNPQIVHDIHLRKSDHIQPDALAIKLSGVSDGSLRIVYLGRADQMKGSSDWVAVLQQLDALGVDFRATWLGDGPALAEMRATAEQSGLGARVAFPGFTSDRDAVFVALRQAQVFMFCHKTPESPRCLIESLVSGTPIVGYDSAFARDLISLHGGGLLVPKHDVRALARALADLAMDRERLGQLIGQAAKDGAPFDDEAVFQHRSQIISTHLAPQEHHLTNGSSGS